MSETEKLDTRESETDRGKGVPRRMEPWERPYSYVLWESKRYRRGRGDETSRGLRYMLHVCLVLEV